MKDSFQRLKENIYEAPEKRMRLYLGLVHFPVLNKHGQRVASALTTLDIHDIARLARTYGIVKFFVITPLCDQQEMAERILRHWTQGFGAGYNPDRKKAMELVAVLPSLKDAVACILGEEGEPPFMIATGAGRQKEKALSYIQARSVLEERVVLLLFGTAWGLEKEVFEQADYILEPVYGRGDYNHLSVRSAAAIILDRLVGR
jgi:hypothetical protein